MAIVGGILRWILLLYMACIFARIIIGWLPVQWPKGLRPLVVFIFDITEPLLSPLRRVIPVLPLGRGLGLDLSPTVLIIVILFLQWLVKRVFC